MRQAVQGVTDLILRPGLVNVDFADVRTIMTQAGTAIMGIGEGKGEDRASKAANLAINSPLMDGPINGAKGVLFNVTGGPNVGIHEIQEAAEVVTKAADSQATILWGHVLDPDMDEKIQITVIATGFAAEGTRKRPRIFTDAPVKDDIEEETNSVLVEGKKPQTDPLEDMDRPSVTRKPAIRNE